MKESCKCIHTMKSMRTLVTNTIIVESSIFEGILSKSMRRRTNETQSDLP